ncbi:alpha/beta hydrolase [Lactococcus garvieae]|uniref:alpha/beta hydrolase n=1 Tax=Lactococcus garvieae TaxID=1363 RepID=UPI0018D6374B|nr:alpha/beta hydrolase [Lactococcus garvieae]QPS72035.1 alpha/beta hydrolase [Lactococcus garvieae]
MKAWYLPAEKATDKTILLANGYKSVRDRYGAFGWLFHDLGYNVRMPDYRAGAQSPGKYIGFGWLDRLDNKAWIEKIVTKNPHSLIAMFGISMGAAATMMVSGENLPNNVKCFIEDCGYDTVWNELTHKAKSDYHLPPFPLIYLLSFWSKLFAGYDWKEASAVNQLRKNKKPFLFIHGDQDTFVPPEMVYRNYEATQGPKEIYIAKGGRHVRSYEIDKEKYRAVVECFLNKYF